MKNKLNIKIVSDLICPWCYIARTRLEKIFNETGLKADVHWLPYELNPDMPENGLDRKQYRSKKFGSWEYSQRLDRGVEEHGKPLGLNFQYEKVLKTPNTLKGHRLIWLAETNGISDAVSIRMFKAYFEEGKDIGDVEVLKTLGQEAGLGEQDVTELFSSDIGDEEVEVLIDWAKTQGVQSVPFIIVNDQFAFSGAQSDESIKAVFRKALGEDEKAEEMVHG